MRFGVLGPLAVWSADGKPVRVPELKVRALLADLLIQGGRAVSVEQLIDDLWGTDLPVNPSGALQIKVSRLRRALEEAEAGAGRLVTSQPSGYLLRIDPEALDASRFQDLTRRARTTDDPQARAVLLADALELWRGPPFADFGDDPFAQATITRLAEDRLVALEEQAEVRLELGEHSLLVGELGDLVTRHPLRQRLRAAHMRALYRAGRHSEALDSYANLRNRLAQGLGLDPSTPLVDLHQAILRQDPELASVPARSLARPSTNLPATITDLIGRAGAISEVRSLLKSGRLVTLTGPGGVGKTRLAVETTRELRDAFADGVWLVELAAHDRLSTGEEKNSPVDVVDLVASALGVRDDPTPGAPGKPLGLVDQLAGAVRAKRLLLILDNCEHVVEPIAVLAETLLHAAPQLRVLATSREPLAIPGELLWTVPPLEFPPPESDAEPGLLKQASAVQLFVARAAAAVPGFAVGPHNASAVAAICRRLDGLPLALEMAASRVRTLGVHELVDRLDDRFRVLTAGHRGAPARQQTLRAMIDWSWELATPAERAALRRLAVHAEGCTLAAAEVICAGEDVRSAEVPDLLVRLVDRSLVVVLADGDRPRYRLLESVRAYCVERLHEAGEFETVQRRHLDYYTRLAEGARPHLYGPDQRQWLERLDSETANLRTAIESAVQLRDAVRALRLANALAWYWFLRGRLTEARRSLGLALGADGGASSPVRAQATAWQTGIALLASAGTNPAVWDNAVLTSYEDIVDPGARARAQWFLGFAHRGIGDLSTTANLVNGALAEFRALRDRWGIAAALSVRATLGRARGDLAQAKRDAETGLALFREVGDRWGQLKAINTLGALAEIAGDYVEAVRLHRDGLRMAEGIGLWSDASFRLSGLGRISLLTGDLVTAEKLHQRAMRLATGQFDQVAEEFAEIGLALGARRQGKLDMAEAHLRKWLDWLRRMDGEPGLALVLAELGFIAEQRGEVVAAMALHADSLAAARKVGDPRAVAMALEGLAGVQAVDGHPNHAAQLLGTATALRESVGAPLPDAERGDVDRITARTRAVLGERDFLVYFQRGRTLDPDEQPLPPHHSLS